MGTRYVGVGAETTYGTEVNPTRYFEALTESVQLERSFDNIEVIRGYSTRQVVELTKRVAGDVEILANYDGIGILFDHLLGSSTSVTGSINTHTFPATTGIPAADRIGKSLTVEVQRDDQLVFKYNGCKIIGFTHSFGTDQASRFTLSMLGKDAATETTGNSPSYSTLLPLSPSHVTFNIDGTATSARNVTITVENPLDEPYVLGSTAFGVEPDRSGVLKVTGSAEILVDDFVEYNKYDGTTDVDFQVTATNGTESITYNMDKCRVLQATPTVSGRERLSATIEWEAFYNTDATENFQVVLANNDATP